MTRSDKDKPVVLSRIYTRTGDDGTTALNDMSRVPKTDARLAAYADVEEANAHLGVALSHGTLPAELAEVLARVQNELFDVGADLATPVVAEPAFPPLRVEQAYVDRLEALCDRFNADLKPLRSFILPGGDPATAALHVARVTVRRAERTTWAALEAHDDMNPLTAAYLNRLSDLLFILCRVAHAGEEILWKPGATR
ncbi:cob(I)yrinic acid a,c-diamide adenosyltransferase [Nonomuraea rhodomycinica]|uniref:Corrinoid adenosyltransferase n=1 Tax=Nonomuraea rhodomycinica TaxID=1712872 RepID=A0A7Y6INI7_9ACTN|nr:cob(I)yrinic acid a,c-diamide adenosyltransferase [Nonomuraea rhodomycinica]NUW41519.1 cob(I)yrinic acid a,c-diamide adenosyltransferase [Nonomuraea rhodomycinica]